MIKQTAVPSARFGKHLAVLLTVLIGFSLEACSRDEREAIAPSYMSTQSSVAAAEQTALDSALAVHHRHTFRLIAIPGVVGTAVGLTGDGHPVIKIFTKTGLVAGLPENLEGIPVEVQVTGEFLATPRGALGVTTKSTLGPANFANTDRWPTPVPIGISTGNEGECSAGTIGARVKSGSTLYALSNNHVYALENQAPLNSKVLQPGRYDTKLCFPTDTTKADSATILGTLSAFAPIAFCNPGCANNTIDAAIALTDATRLGNQTPLSGFGTPGSVAWTAFLGLGVKKYGRTTSMTTGQVTGIDATVLVGYASGTAQFVHQVVVQTCSPTCSGPGDSGSLWVTNDSNPNPVGLNFAGNDAGSLAVANQIADVLKYFGVTVDGPSAPTASGGLTAHKGSGCGVFQTTGFTITAVTASGSNAVNLKDSCGNTGAITLSGVTASGGLTAHKGSGCGAFQTTGFTITAVTASGTNAINLKDSCGNTGAITLSGARASGGLTARKGSGCDVFQTTGFSITAVTASGFNAIILKDSCGNTGYVKLDF